MKTDDWLNAACADAEGRGLAAMKPLLEALARSTAALRELDRSIRPPSDPIPAFDVPAEADRRT